MQLLQYKIKWFARVLVHKQENDLNKTWYICALTHGNISTKDNRKQSVGLTNCYHYSWAHVATTLA